HVLALESERHAEVVDLEGLRMLNGTVSQILEPFEKVLTRIVALVPLQLQWPCQPLPFLRPVRRQNRLVDECHQREACRINVICRETGCARILLRPIEELLNAISQHGLLSELP